MLNYTLNISSRTPFIFNGSNALQTNASVKLEAKDLGELSRLVSNIAATVSMPAAPNHALIRTLAQMPLYMSENRTEWNVRNEPAGFTICLIPYTEPYDGPHRRYDLKVVSKSDYLTTPGSSIRFNEITIDIPAISPQHLSDRIREFISGIVPFYGMDSGLDQETINDIMEMRIRQVEALSKFAEVNTPEVCWVRHPVVEVYEDAHLEISLIYQNDF